LVAAVLRIIARRPVLAFMVIGLGGYFLTVAIRPIADADVLPYGLPLHGFLGGLLGVGLGAFLVTGGWRDGAGMRVVLDVGRAGVPGDGLSRTRLVKLPAVRQPSPHQAAGYRNQ
jgi:hypothetical protein